MVDTRYRILGPLEVWDGHRWAAPSATKQRQLLAVLLCNANQVVSSERLQEELWGDDIPPTARQLVHGYVARLRRLLADLGGARLATRPNGYQLVTQPGELDAEHFTRLLDEGRRALREQSFEEAAGRFGEALGCWRGPVLVGVTAGPSIDATRTRLAAAHLIAAECHAQAELACGRHQEALPVLAALVSEYPLQEELRGYLMVALYRSGQQAAALASYRDLRNRLVEELGIEPGPNLS